MKKIILLVSFFLIAPLNLLASISLLSYQLNKDNHVLGVATEPVYAALPPQENSLQDFVVSAEAKTEIVRQFLARYSSPLVPHAQLLVDSAEKYNLDYRLLPAIAMQESNLCKKAPADSNNCWGYGIYGGKVKKYENYDLAIESVAKGLGNNYVAKGLIEPEDIMKIYTPSNDGSWAASVNHFMAELR